MSRSFPNICIKSSTKLSDLVNSNLKNSLPSIEVLKNRLKSLGVTSKPIDFKASSSFSLLSPSNSSLTF